MFLSQQKEVSWEGRKGRTVIKTGKEGRGTREDSVHKKEEEEENTEAVAKLSVRKKVVIRDTYNNSKNNVDRWWSHTPMIPGR